MKIKMQVKVNVKLSLAESSLIERMLKGSKAGDRAIEVLLWKFDEATKQLVLNVRIGTKM